MVKVTTIGKVFPLKEEKPKQPKSEEQKPKAKVAKK